MLRRIDDFFAFLDITGPRRSAAEQAARQAADRAEGMTHLQDYLALAAMLSFAQPRRIFEIGTFLGVTSDFFLSLLPECRVVSIAYQNPRLKLLGKSFNNSELPREKVGSMVSQANRPRFTQLYGDSHKLTAQEMLSEHGGPFDLIFIDGDHSRQGVAQDTELARAILADGGTICWHDANPKEKYLGVRQFLEIDLPQTAIATAEGYLGGVAGWSRAIEGKLAS